MTPHPILRWMLWPLSLLYGAAVVTRAWLYRSGVLKQKRLKGVVISVGNLTAGGTGKTPTVIWLAKQLLLGKRKLGILTRGYSSSPLHSPLPDRLPMGFDRMSDEIKIVFDELGGEISYGIGANRHEKGLGLERAGVEWFLLDDGFQHLALHRDANILLVDATSPFDGGHLLPAGRMREPRGAMARADIVLVTRSSHAPAVEEVIRHFTPVPVFYAQARLRGFRRSERSDLVADWENLVGKPAYAFAGIGNPEAFFEDLKQWGVLLAGNAVYPDHRRYGAADAEAIEQRALSVGAHVLICTAKDEVNLGGTKWGDGQFKRVPLFVADIEMAPTEPQQFMETLYAVIERKRAPNAGR